MPKNQTKKEQMQTIALRFAQEGWGARPNWQKIWDETVSDNVVHHFNNQPDLIVGLEANKAFNTSLFQGFPHLAQTIDSLLIDGDMAGYRATLTGAHMGEFLGIPPTGKTVKLGGFTLLKIVDSKIVEWWYDSNLLALMEQLGVSA